MSSFFLSVLNMSLTASYVVFMVMLARLVLKKAPKMFSYALWLVVLFRLVCPFSFESIFSLIPTKKDAIPHGIIYSYDPIIKTGVNIADNTVNQSLQPALPAVTPAASINPMGIIMEIASVIWMFGMIIMISYGMVSYFKLKRGLSTATLVMDNIFETDLIQTPFVLGLLKPRIYIPTELSENELEYVMKHEQTHIRRKDNIIKIVAFLVLALHWFNPMIWLSYFLVIKDMEMSCDESVMKQSSQDIRANYSKSLLSFSVKQSGLLSPLAFGESNVKSRIRNIIKYKRPAFWIVIVAIVIVITVAAGLLMNPKNTDPDLSLVNIDNALKRDDAAIKEDIDKLLTDIMSSPSYSSRTDDYIEAHPKEYNEITLMGEEALPYLIEILDSSDRGLRGNLVKLLCEDIVKTLIKSQQVGPETDKLIKETLTAIDNWNTMMGYNLLMEDVESLPDFSEEEVEAARAVVEEYYRAIAVKDDKAILNTLTPKHNHPNEVFYGEGTRTLMSVEYNSDDPMRESYVRYGQGSINNIKIENVIVFKVSFSIEYPEGVSGSFEGVYPNWSIILIRDDKDSSWLIDEQGV